MRPSCTKCARKHLSQAIVLLQEARLGYPEHYYLAMGHMAEASDELVVDYYKHAVDVRAVRLQLEADRNFVPDLMGIILELEMLTGEE